jgi:FkbM family methyltransferase
MTVLDIGAHRGFHTLLLSKQVESRGQVLAFEPSSRDLKRLRLHLRLNFCRNVKVFPWALGESDGTASLFVVEKNTVQNSLRPQVTVSPGVPKTVVVRQLDKVLAELGIARVHYVKLDVEGAELDVLKGADHLLRTVPRPVILCEILRETTGAWGYSSQNIVDHLSERGFVWFELNDNATLVPTDERSEFQGNFIAVPSESAREIVDLFSDLPRRETAMAPNLNLT